MLRVLAPPWLLLIHVLPGRPTSLRVKTWRRLQHLGAVSLKHAVWVLPHTAQAREDFEWMRTEIRQMGGEATVMAADGIDAFSSDQIVSAFRDAREPDYAGLEKAARRLASRSAATRAREVPRLASQLETLEAITRAEGKPDQAIPKIVEGRVNAWIADQTLLEQKLIPAEKVPVADALGGATIVRFAQAPIG